MLQFSFHIPFGIALVFLAFMVVLHVIYRKNAEELIQSLRVALSKTEDVSHQRQVALTELTVESNHTVKRLNDSFSREVYKLKSELATSQQLATDLQKTLTALRVHKANQRNRKANPHKQGHKP